MVEPERPHEPGILRELLHTDGRLVLRLRGILRFEVGVFAELEADTHAIPQAVAVVIGTALLVGLGQGSWAGLFLGVASAIALWLLATGLIWAVAVLQGKLGEYARLLRCLGFAFLWFALLLGAGLPLIGPLLLVAAPLLSLASMVVAARQVLGVSSVRAAAICTLALGGPFLLLAWTLR